MAALLHQLSWMSIARVSRLFAVFAALAACAVVPSSLAQQEVLPPGGWLPSAPLTPGASAVDCYNNATNYGLLSQQDAYSLCVGARNTAPFDCFQQAQRSNIDQTTALKLCRCTISTGRIDCYTQAHRTTELSEAEIINLCTHDINSSPACSPSAPPAG
jgi:hypothetical protein